MNGVTYLEHWGLNLPTLEAPGTPFFKTEVVERKSLELKEATVIAFDFEVDKVLTDQEFTNEMAQFLDREIEYIRKRKKEIFGS